MFNKQAYDHSSNLVDEQLAARISTNIDLYAINILFYCLGGIRMRFFALNLVSVSIIDLVIYNSFLEITSTLEGWDFFVALRFMLMDVFLLMFNLNSKDALRKRDILLVAMTLVALFCAAWKACTTYPPSVLNFSSWAMDRVLGNWQFLLSSIAVTVFVKTDSISFARYDYDRFARRYSKETETAGEKIMV